jgi:hypothetical protein
MTVPRKHLRYWMDRAMYDQANARSRDRTYQSLTDAAVAASGFPDAQLVGKPPHIREQMLRPPDERSRCAFKTSDGRTCRMLRADLHPDLCHFHAENELRELSKSPIEPLAAAILDSSRELRTAASVNHALGKLFQLLADGRVDPRRSSVLAYIAQLALQAQAALRQEKLITQGSGAPSR